MRIEIPDPALILLIGPSGAGKSTFAARHFRATEIVSSDRCRAMLCDDEANQAVSAAAFSLLHHIARDRLALGRLTVIDATNLQARARIPLLRMAAALRLPTAAIVFNPRLETCLAHNRARPDRFVIEDVLREHLDALHRTLPQLAAEGYVGISLLDESNFSDIEVHRTVRDASHSGE
ncbi:MAG: ATP-binding protein [Blastocatellia bacterium]|nr:ATP-binding protein [Blastocatellia bacterium]